MSIKSLLGNPKILSVIIGILTLLSFSPSYFNDFTNWDDPVYILENPMVTSLSAENIKNIFTTSVHGSYLPLPILTYAIEYNFVKLGHPAVQHTTNLLIHVCNAILVFWFIYLLFGNLPVALMTTLLFALCPLRVESVAWATQRKDLLYLLFSLCGFLAYLKYLRLKLNKHLMMTFAFFILALLSKPQAIAFPVFLILIDAFYNKKKIFQCVADKVPFFILSVIFILIALSTISPELGKQSTAGIFSFQEKIFLTSFALFLYFLKSLFPFYISCLYPFPYNISGHFPWTVYTATAVLLLGGIFFYKKIKNDPQYQFGILWFLAGLMLPLSNIWVGGYLICDHYTYLASIGFYAVIAVLIYRLYSSTKIKAVKEWAVALFSIYIFFFAFNSVSNSFIWNNSQSLWTNAIETFPNLPIAYNNRAEFYISFNMLDKAFDDTNQALALAPNDISYLNRGIIYAMADANDEAFKDFTRALEYNPKCTDAFFNRALIYKSRHDYPNALLDLESALRLDPKDTRVLKEQKNLLNLIHKG